MSFINSFTRNSVRHANTIIFCFTLIIAFGLLSTSAHAVQHRPRIMFLGDQGLHKPADRAATFIPEMTRRGIDITYTENTDDLNPTTLSAFDGLLIYANINTITPSQEKALLDFVQQGKGAIPLHSASFCFRNSEAYVALVGGQFKRHGKGDFTTKFQNPNHPILKNLKPFTSWDETYVHAKHNDQNRTILSIRHDDEGAEPYTWTRTHGKGRVFYTAWGHDERTWTNSGFLNLVERGIRWACGDWAMEPAPKLKPFQYVDANLPHYIEGGDRARPQALGQMQSPLSPQESMKHMAIPRGFHLELFASEPDIFKPIYLNWDERGRLWIAETVDYPNNMQQPGQGNDRISILEDTNNDGRADKFTVFADKLSIPTSFAFANGGIVITQAPDTLFLKDTNGDDKADIRKTLFSGWGIQDTHAGPSNLRYGFDNWLWGIVGYSGFNGQVGDERHSFNKGFFRMKPDGSELEFIRSTNNNSWGLGFSENGIVFGSTANNNPSVYMPIANRYYESVTGWSAARLESIAQSAYFAPITDKVRQVDQFGKFTSGAGHALYTARAFPKEYWNTQAFVAGPTGHLLQAFTLKPDGSNFTAHTGQNMLASDDEWTAPTLAEVGPDSQLWIVDWYNYIIQHNPVPYGFEKGKGNAYATNLRDKTHGRIYRLVADNSPEYKPIDLSNASIIELVKTLRNDNLFWRLTAQRLLVERADPELFNVLFPYTFDTTTDAVGLNPGALHALNTIHGLGLLDGTNTYATRAALDAFTHPSMGVRRTALQVAPRTQATLDAILNNKLLDDSEPQVRLQALLTLSELPPSKQAGQAIFAMLQLPQNKDDLWMLDAAISAGARHAQGYLNAIIAAAQNNKSTQPTNTSNLLLNNSFENINKLDNGVLKPVHWYRKTYSGAAELAIGKQPRTGENSLRITSKEGADASWSTDITVQPQTNYTLSGWIKTINAGTFQGGKGALLNVHQIQSGDYKKKAVAGTQDWTYFEMPFNTGPKTNITINCLFGGWGKATGTAFFDDISVRQSNASSMPGRLIQAANIISQHYASQAPTNSIAATLIALKDTPSTFSSRMLDGISIGWPKGKSPSINAAQESALTQLMASLSTQSKTRLLTLAAKWNRPNLFASDAAAVITQLKKTIANTQASTTARSAAAHRLIELNDTPQSIQNILAQVAPQSPPLLATELIASLNSSQNAHTADALIAHWPKLSPKAKSTAIAVLMRRPQWTTAMLQAIKSNVINRAALTADKWLTLSQHADPTIKQLATSVQGVTSSPDKLAVIKQFMPAAQATGNTAAGRLRFEQLCMACHRVGNKGGFIGPNLNGFGAHPKPEILAEIIDPNRSVEMTYQLWTVTTTDNQTLAGKLQSESKTAIELLDIAGQLHIIQRNNIQSMTASNLSLMPPGLEHALGQEGMTDLLEYLSTLK